MRNLFAQSHSRLRKGAGFVAATAAAASLAAWNVIPAAAADIPLVPPAAKATETRKPAGLGAPTWPVRSADAEAGPASPILPAECDPNAVEYRLDGEVLSPSEIQLEDGLHTLRVQVTDRARNTGGGQIRFFGDDKVENALAPQRLMADRYSTDREVLLVWTAPEEGGLEQYEVYRIDPDGSENLLDTLGAGETSYTDTVSADGEYIYYVAAKYEDGDEAGSGLVTTLVDTAAPTIDIASPSADEAYEQDQALQIQVTISDETAGDDKCATRYWLDGNGWNHDAINLRKLTAGSHTFKVEAKDRAGNAAVQSVTFQVTAPTVEGGDDEDERNPKDGKYLGLMQLLATHQADIQRGHYSALLAKLRAGNIDGFVAHVAKFRGKFIAPETADELLAAVAEICGDDLGSVLRESDDKQGNQGNGDKDPGLRNWKQAKPGNPEKGKGGKK